jgi:hypothetical protein
MRFFAIAQNDRKKAQNDRKKLRRCPEEGEGMTERKLRMKIIMLPLGKAEGFFILRLN